MAGRLLSFLAFPNGSRVRHGPSLLAIARHHGYPSLVVNYVSSLAVAWRFWTAGHGWAAYWLAGVTATTFVRTLVIAAIPTNTATLEQRSPAYITRSLRLLGAGLLAGAAFWSVFAWLALSEPDPRQQYTALIVITAMAAGAVGVLQTFPLIGAAYICLVVLPAVLRILTVPGLDPVLAVLGLVFTAVMVIGHRHGCRTLIDSICLRDENATLVSRVLRNNQELEERVAQRTERLREEAHRDQLTGLLNRHGLNAAFAERVRASSGQAQIFFLDLDRFKHINDSLGHEAGDHVLEEVARRLLALRVHWDIDIARWGGDEFVCAVWGDPAAWDPAPADAVPAIAHGAVVSRKYHCDISVSTGFARYPADRSSLEELVDCADLACSEAKRRGRGLSVAYNPSFADAVERRATIANDISAAMAHGELSLVYQPIVDARTGAIESVEVLLRWAHRELGVLAPDEFIAIAEESDQIAALGAFVMEGAFRRLAATDARSGNFRMAVNVSVRQLLSDDFAESVLAAIARSGISPGRVEIEITETAFHADDEFRVLTALRRLSSYGVAIAIDDFGTGYSSLARLKEFPVDRLKIDRKFVSALDPKAQAIIEGTILIARRFGMTIVAEGVETVDQARTLAAMGVDHLQGYLVGMPTDFEAITASAPWLEETAIRRAVA